MSFESWPVARKEEREDLEWMRRKAVFAAALGLLVCHDVAEAETDGLKEHAVLEQMVERGPVRSDDCEKVFSREFEELPLRNEKEVAFAAVYSKEGTCRIVALGVGGDGEVKVDGKKADDLLRDAKINRIVFYHTHPVKNYFNNDETSLAEAGEVQAGAMPHYDLSPPSGDDLMIMSDKEIRKQKATRGTSRRVFSEERVVTGLGIWHFGMLPGANPNGLYDDATKLGSLYGYYQDKKGDPNIARELDAIKKGYAEVGASYDQIKYSAGYSSEAKELFRQGDAHQLIIELEQKVKAAERYGEAMGRLGFSIGFHLHPKHQSLLQSK